MKSYNNPIKFFHNIHILLHLLAINLVFLLSNPVFNHVFNDLKANGNHMTNWTFPNLLVESVNGTRQFSENEIRSLQQFIEKIGYQLILWESFGLSY